MNRQGQVELGAILLAFIVVIVGVVLMVASAQLVGDTTNTQSFTNISLAAPANGATVNLNGKFVTDFVAINSTNATGGQDDIPVIGAGNFTIVNNQVVNGEETARITVDDTQFQSTNWNVTYTTQPTTYISNSGGRAIANIIIVFFALAIVVVTLFPTLRNKVIESFR